MEKNLSLERIGFSYASNSALYVDRKNEVMMFFGDKAAYIKSTIAMVNGTPMAEEAYRELLEIFNLYTEVTEQELLKKGYVITSYRSDKEGTYRIEISLPSKEPISSVSKTVLRNYKLQA
jgi:hypothetical protein